MSRVENLVRFSQIGRIFARHGFGFVFDVRRGQRARRGSEEVLGPNFGVRLRRALEEGRYTEKVVADEELARKLGVSSVPTMLVGPADAPLEEAEVITGAQPYGGRIEAAVGRALERGAGNSEE